MGNIRVFIAIKVPCSTRIHSAYTHFQTELKGEKVKWVDPNHLHITLKFIGATEERLLPLLIRRLEDSALKSNVFEIQLKGFGVFPRVSRPKILWLGIEGSKEIKLLKKNIEEELKYMFPSDDMEFRAHITVGRVKQRPDPEIILSTLEKNKEMGIERLVVDHFVLMQSQLHSSGPVYVPLHEFCLRKK